MPLLQPGQELEEAGEQGQQPGVVTPYLAQGRIRFKAGSPGARLLVEQLRDFPCGEHDDGPDALEMAVRLAGGLLRSARQEQVTEILVTV